MIDLKKVRQDKDMTQDELAEKIGTVRQTISNIEIGISKPSIPTAIALAKVLGIKDWRKFFED